MSSSVANLSFGWQPCCCDESLETFDKRIANNGSDMEKKEVRDSAMVKDVKIPVNLKENVPDKARLTRGRQAVNSLSEECGTGVDRYGGVESLSAEPISSQNALLKLHRNSVDDIFNSCNVEDKNSSTYHINNIKYKSNKFDFINSKNGSSTLDEVLQHEAVLLYSDVITTHPTLLPRSSSSRDRLDSPAFEALPPSRSIRNSSLASLETLLHVNNKSANTYAVTTFSPTSTSITSTSPITSIESSLFPLELPLTDSASDLSRLTMGYTADATLTSSWGVTDNKMFSHETGSLMSADKLSNSQHSLPSHEKKDQEDDDMTIQSFGSTTVGSPPMTSFASLHVQTLPTQHAFSVHSHAVETPSTVSTAFSSIDDNSLEGGHIYDRFMPQTAQSQYSESFSNNRYVSWESSPRDTDIVIHPSMPNSLHSQHPLPNAWSTAGARGQSQQHRYIARREEEIAEEHRFGFPPMSPSDTRWQQQRSAPHLPFLPPGRATPTMNNRLYRPVPTSPFNSYQHSQQRNTAAFLQQLSTPPTATNTTGIVNTANSTNVTPARLPRQRAPTPSPHRPTQSISTVQTPSSQVAASNARSSSEVLKTFLRKKACLYEPDTSRAVALVTWLVGRELALQHGFFSRQQLQAGVHACVADKIDSGAITRTKVNRCMQIILNSCFHYIIPRPDGTEENGEPFRKVFATEVKDESFLLKFLPKPWNDIVVNRDEILKACAAEMDPKPTHFDKKNVYSPSLSTPQSSPLLSSVSPDKSPSKESLDGDAADHKRAVLLCFNENVRCAEDVFRCHNEFIRDTAHASHLQLSSQEWHSFFGNEAAGAPYLWGNIGIPVPFSDAHGLSHIDALGMMTKEEAGKFRTSWCTKRYDHDHELCGFAHAHTNGGWLRRNSDLHNYRDEMCPDVTTVSEQGSHTVFVINACPLGEDCDYAHSMEEIVYHPRRYKLKACSSSSRLSGCHLGDVCPYFHPTESYRFPKKSESRSLRHSRHNYQAGGMKGVTSIPYTSPILYCSPAPVSSFEKQLLVPGLQNLYRRHCSVLRAHIHRNEYTCNYSYFGDDSGINMVSNDNRRKETRGLPNPIAQQQPIH